MDPPTAVTVSHDPILSVDLDLDPRYMEELQLVSQEPAESVLTIQGELSKFKGFGVKYLEWCQRSKFKKESNHSIVKKFFRDHEAIFPKLTKLVKSMINLPPSSSIIEREFSNIKEILTPNRNRTSDTRVLQLLKAKQYESFMKIIKS